MKSRGRLLTQLRYQLNFLRNSGRLYDQGFSEESIRIAVALENILSLRKNATSLVKHLKADNIKLFSTSGSSERKTEHASQTTPTESGTSSSAGRNNLGIIMLDHLSITDAEGQVASNSRQGLDDSEIDKTIVYVGLGIVALGTRTEDSSYFPDVTAPSEEKGHRLLTISDWMDEVVLVTNRRISIQRKELIVTARNKDGGGHVVNKFKGAYNELSRDGAMGYFHGNKFYAPNARLDNFHVKPVSIKNAHFVALRQMANEVLFSPDIIELESHAETLP